MAGRRGVGARRRGASAGSAAAESEREGAAGERRSLTDGDSRTYYTVEVCLDRSELPLPASVRLVLQGQPAGRLPLLSMPATGETRASLPLQGVLLSLEGSLADFAPSTVIPFLQENLAVDIQQVSRYFLPSSIPSDPYTTCVFYFLCSPSVGPPG